MKKTALRYDATGAENALCHRIIGAAFEAFVENGYAGTTTLEIATRAKVSKRDLYANFPNKQAVLLQCITNRAARMQLSRDLPAPRSREMLAQILVSFGATVLREVSQPAVIAIYRLAISEGQRSPEVAAILNASRAANRNALAELLDRARASGILGHGDPRQMVEQFFGFLWGDLMLNRLLGAVGVPIGEEIDRRARGAAEAILKLHGEPMPDATDGVGEAPSF
jgi:AcrR family transcriptional regulator